MLRGTRLLRGIRVLGCRLRGLKDYPSMHGLEILKDKNPALASVEQSPDVKDAIGKIKAMKDPREAVDAFNALQALQQLMALKSAQEAQ